jgi:hypothetical protein
VETPAGTRTVSAGAPLTIPTRAAGPGGDNLARCRPVTANAADPSAPAVAAVDGSTITAWTPDTDPATPSTLTVRLAGRQASMTSRTVVATRSAVGTTACSRLAAKGRGTQAPATRRTGASRS